MEPNVDSNSTPNTESTDSLKPKSSDVGWEFAELINANNLRQVKCKLCGKELNGGINRLKYHIAGITGNVKACPRSTPLDKEKCKRALEELKKTKKEKKMHIQEVRDEVDINDSEDDGVQIQGSVKKPRTLGPMDQFSRPIDLTESTVESRRNSRQQNLNDALFKHRTDEVHAYLARWVYESGIPFNAINNDGFQRFCEAVGQFGPGYIPASQYQLREPLLKQEVEKTKNSMKEQEEEWKANGCSLMTDAWSDRNRRSIMNLCVNCKAGTSFISSIESSQEAHTGKYIFEYVDKYIGEIGCENVIQVVTDNASNNMAAAKLLKVKRPNIFWTSCATHTLNLILEGIGNLQSPLFLLFSFYFSFLYNLFIFSTWQLIYFFYFFLLTGKIPRIQHILEKAKALTIFIYAHHTTLALMRKFTKKRNIIRPGITRFASSFLTLQSILEKEEKLKYMFLSKEWGECKWSTKPKGIKTYQTIVSQAFWMNIAMCVELFKPLVKVLRLVDGDWRPSMAFVYGQIKEAKTEIIRVCKNSKETYEPILEIIDSKIKGRLDSPLHLTAYLLNPYYYYKDKEVVGRDANCMAAVITCIEAFFPDDYDLQDMVGNVELLKYKNMEGMFGKKLAIMGRMRNEDNFDIGILFNSIVFTTQLHTYLVYSI